MSKLKKVSVSELKVHALRIIESVNSKKTEVEVYKRGKLVARIVPIVEENPSFLGCMEGWASAVGDPSSILEPLDVKWNALENSEDLK